MVGAYKFLVLLSTPFPLLDPLPPVTRLAGHAQVPLASLSFPVSGARRRLLFSCAQPGQGFRLRAAEQVHTQATIGGECGGSAGSVPGFKVSSHPWPEWVKLVEHVTARGYMDRLVSPAHGEDDDSFATSVELPEEFVKAAGACLSFARERPDLLRWLRRRDTEVVVENGSPFLFKNAPNSVRRMKSFISGDGINVLGDEQAYTADVMKYLLSYACNSYSAGGENSKCGEFVEASVRSLLSELVKVDGGVHESNITDSVAGYIPSRNEQSQKPLGQTIEMKRGDWICPKCSFMNFARNMKCLECQEARPRRQLTGKEWECPQCEFYNYGKNVACLRCECKRPGEILALERRLTSAQSRSDSGNEDSVKGSDFIGGKMSESTISQRLDRILGRSSATSETKDNGNQPVVGEVGIRTGNRFTSPERKDSGYVPFVPLPPDMFRKNTTDEQQSSVKEDFAPLKANQLTNTASGGPESGKSDELLYAEDYNHLNVGKANQGLSNPSETLPRKDSQLSDDNNLANSVLNNDFPEIMPMRKGESRFVVSKKKDRSLTSPQYKKRIAMEQANNSNFVPFVPFPPGYFAKKDKQPEDGSSTASAAETSASSVAGNVHGMPQKGEEGKAREANRESPTLAQHTNKLRNNNAESAGRGSAPECGSGANSSGSLGRQVQNPPNHMENGNQGFSGKSLEGSAVTEPDPLDMSEEAKAQRWFRRVAQINDISELSKIPDEDFPEIMPMRKGVNRFVVSKRKTPLERRLTSPQYRRNLPIVSSEPEKDSG